jgi:predicted kinase
MDQSGTLNLAKVPEPSPGSTNTLEQVAKAFTLPEETTAHPALIVVSGLPGTGKSYLARRLAERLPCVILETDHVRQLLFAQPRYTGQENETVFQVCHDLIRHLLGQGVRVIFDATNLVERHREVLYHIADQAEARLVLVRTVCPEPVVRVRLLGRADGADPQDHSAADFRVHQRLKYTEEPIRRNHLVVNTSQDLSLAISKILRAVRQR